MSRHVGALATPAGIAVPHSLVAGSIANRIAAVHLPGGKATPWPLRGLEAPDDPTCSAP